MILSAKLVLRIQNWLYCSKQVSRKNLVPIAQALIPIIIKLKNDSMSHQQNNSRRDFLTHSAIFGLGMLLPKDMLAFGPNPDSKFGGVQMGVITYSFRSMPGNIDQLIDYCKTCGINAIELMGEPAEAFAGSPVPFGGPGRDSNGPKLSQQDRMKMAREWRESASMDKFVELRKKLSKEGITVYAFKPTALNENNSDGEI
jgi:hypothetical protein